MKWLNTLERRFGRYAIRNLMTYIVVLNAVVFLLSILVPDSNLVGKFILHPELVLRGEVWRLVTFLFIPPSFSILWIVFVLYFYYLIGSSLEQQWGSFRFNIYYLVGVLATIAASFISNSPVTPVHLNLSLFLAFAFLFPNFELMLFFFLPIKIKYLAWLEWLFIAFSVITQPLPNKLTAIASVVNYFIFFGRDLIDDIKTRRRVYTNRKKFRKAMKEHHRD
jgi:membrane associated rhomboid family serine protease